MGSLCSKSSVHEGGHNVLGSSPGTPINASGRPNPQASRPQDPRAAAAEAAERRLQAAQKRGTNTSNPNQGKLAQQLAKENSSRPNPVQEQREERLVWD
ncbi:hypothetical protein D9613_001831 [Agrocybe pediades]|uniref:Uncharacterized protein n=1 Tax=Agrocybe pediades TaxID=84607 RepID=A0A8H4R585_9AGAR|nr:hypothetical protein D9613_001831 [Agrocybe pediades]KAF9569599.1 hypothetical protein CPC08DRAFT_701512 [Agrocybe pediades]